MLRNARLCSRGERASFSRVGDAFQLYLRDLRVRKRASETSRDVAERTKTVGVEGSVCRSDDLSGEPVRQGGLSGEVATHSRCSMVRGDEASEFVGAFFPGVCAWVVAPSGEGGEGCALR